MPNIFVSWSTSELRVSLVRCSKFNPFSTLLTDWSNAMLLLWILFVIFNCLCHTVISVGKGLISWLSCMWCFFLWFCYFPIWSPRPDLVLDYIHSWYLPTLLLYVEPRQTKSCNLKGSLLWHLAMLLTSTFAIHF